MSRVLMPQGTAVWLIDNTTLTFDQIAAFLGMSRLEIAAIADCDTAVGIRGFDPVAAGTLSRAEIRRCEADPEARLTARQQEKPAPARFRFRIMGTQFYDASRAALRAGDLLRVRPEPSNPHDRYAIEVLTVDGIKLGYVPRNQSAAISGLIARGACRGAEVQADHGGYPRAIDVALTIVRA